MTTEKKERGFIRDLKKVPSSIFFIFSVMSVTASFVVYGFTVKAAVTGLFSVLLCACASSDIKAGIVPDFIVCLIACVAILSFLLFSSITLFNIADKLFGAFVVAVPMLLCSLIIKGAYGGGDIKMMAACGLYLGWRLTFAGTAVAFLFAGIYAIVLFIRRKADRQSRIPMAPFLAFGVFFASLFGENAIRLLIGY
jgi:leader peptidase (prepilin peptidase)/N-methyltransferase